MNTKKILIIGKDSYIGNNIDCWLTKNGLNVDQLDVLTENWRAFDYSIYDVIVHVAGIVHQPQCQDWELYKRVNTDMPIEIANLAKKQGVRQFIYFSTMGVFGLGKQLKPNIIDENTPLLADGMYGKSKLMAEQGLILLQDNSFNIAFVRPPSVYGKGCKGNYISGFVSIVRRLPIVPVAYSSVKQSMIYIDNLCELVYKIVDGNLKGSFCPQDEKSVNAIINAIGDGLGKHIIQSRLLGVLVYICSFIPIIKKAYGGIEYSQSLSNIEGVNYQIVSFRDGMKRTVSF